MVERNQKQNQAMIPKLGCATRPVNSPLAFIDLDGKDAIAISFPDYKPETPLGRVAPFGHAAIVTITKAGKTRYYEYGRYNGDKRGLAERRGVPNVQMDSDGKPTSSSLDNLLQYISIHYGQHGRISGEYFTTSDQETQQMNDEADKWIGETGRHEHTPYSLCGGPTCATFVQDILRAGNQSVGSHDISIPRSMMWDLQMRNLLNPDSHILNFDPNKHVHDPRRPHDDENH